MSADGADIQKRVDLGILGLALKVDYNQYYLASTMPEAKNVVIKKLPPGFEILSVKKK